MKAVVTRIILLLTVFLVSGCIWSESETRDSEVSVTLSLQIDVTNLPVCLPATKGYEDPETDGEKMQKLRIIIVRPNGTVEHNKFIDLTSPAMTAVHKFEVVGNEEKTVWLVANENNPAVKFDFASLTPGNIVTASVFEDKLIQLNSNDETLSFPLPMSSVTKVKVPGWDYSETLQIVRAATKFTYIIDNNTSNPLYLSNLKINKGARKEYLFPRIIASSDWGDYTDGGNTVTVPGGMLIKDYVVPLVGNNEYYEFQKACSVTIGAGAEVKVDPFFLLEGKYTDDASAGRNYSTTLTINGLDYSGYLPDLPQLPRNTHAVVRAKFSEIGISLKVEVLPYGEVILEPGFGQ
ncbi:MAG: hypothetical protein ACI3Y9_09550 [Candidatus Cryptobacteroides sp.]